MSTRPEPEQYATRSEYRWARRLWIKRHGGSLIWPLLIAVVIGGLSGSALVLIALVLFALLATAYARSRP